MSTTNKKDVHSDLYLYKDDQATFFLVVELLQSLGVNFIDLDTGNLITGQTSINPIGLVLPTPIPKRQTTTKNYHHFLIPPRASYAPPNIDAALSISKQGSDPCLYFTISIIDGRQADIWKGFILEIGPQLINTDKFNNRFPDAHFTLVTLTNPNQNTPNSAIDAVRGYYQKYHTEEPKLIITGPWPDQVYQPIFDNLDQSD